MIRSLRRCSFVFLLAALGGCSHDADTRIHVAVTADPTWNLDHYELRVGEQSALSEALPALDVVVPDDMAGEATAFEVWGLTAGQQVAYGMTTVTPSLHESVNITVALSEVSCGPLCTNGDVECTQSATQDGMATCAMQANGCLAWSITACPTDAPYCANGACAPQCTDECALGQTECDSTVTMRTCGPSTTSTCLVWSAPVACTEGQTCSGQACAAPVVCATDGAACDDGDACTQGDTCNGGICAGTLIACTTPPAPTCANATTLRSYGASGTCSAGTCAYVSSTTTCANGCASGACIAACTVACSVPITVSAGYTATCGVKTDGTLACWGDNTYGESTPPAGSFASVSSGYNLGCGVKTDGTLACWGDNTYGQASAPAGSFASVSAGYNFACGVKTDGTLACWGNDVDGITTPPAGSFASVSAGYNFACGVKSDGTVACWGTNTGGDTTPPAGSFASASAGYNFACGVKSDGTVACWGTSTDGDATPPAGSFVFAGGGGNYACGLHSDGTVACWGDAVVPPVGTFAALSTGLNIACGVMPDGTVTCWGAAVDGDTTPPAGTFKVP